MATLEDLERRVIALERAAERDRSVERAVAEIVVESERRMTDRLNAVEQRLTVRVEASERRMVDILNERFDAVMTAIDRLRP
jgi:hypothetical protein